METTKLTDEERLKNRKAERALHARGLVRVRTYVANLALQHGIKPESGPRIEGAKTDRGLYVPAWFEWHVERFPQNSINQRKRLEIVEELKNRPHAQFILLIEAQMAGGTLYDPCGDLATEAALTLLREEHGDELDG